MKKMKIAVLDLHRWIKNKVYESVKIANTLKNYFDGETSIFEMIRIIPPDINLNEFSAILVSGSDSTHIEKYRGYKITRGIVEKAWKQSIPVLGVCAGSQMLGKMWGLHTEFMDKPEVGWYEIELTENGMKDELFSGLPKKFVSFECHIKRIYENKNKNINILARSQNCIQSVRYDEYVWGIQFHPEDTIEEGNEQIRKYDRREPSSKSAVYSAEKLVGRTVYKNFIEIAKKRIDKIT